MGKISNDNYITIQGWMVNDLNLKGNELLIYAIIFGFSQNGENKYDGGLQYLADWTNSTKQGVQKALKNLVNEGLLIKEDRVINKVKFCSYCAVVDGMQQSCMGMQQSCTNNIYNISNSNSKDTSELSAEPIFEFGMPDEKPKQNLYQKCASHIYSFTEDHNVQKALFEYLDFLLEKSRSEKKPIYENQWKGLLKKLKDIDDKVGSIQYSIQKGYVGFYEPPTQFTSTTPDTNKAVQHNSRPEDWARNADGSLVVF